MTKRSLLSLIVLFVFLSAMDLVLTWALLRDEEVGFYERNPIANWCLGQFGWPGLMAFKLGSMTVGIVCVLLLASRAPIMANRLLVASCFLVTAVVLHSWALARLEAQSQERLVEDDASIRKRRLRLEERMNQVLAYQRLQNRLNLELGLGWCSLDEAVQAIEATPQAKDPVWLRQIRRAYRGSCDRLCIAACTINAVLTSRLHDSIDTAELATRLFTEYQNLQAHSEPRQVEMAAASQRPPLGTRGQSGGCRQVLHRIRNIPMGESKLP